MSGDVAGDLLDLSSRPYRLPQVLDAVPGGQPPDGTVTFTASGIREWNASDHTERFTWEQWDCCIISREVIVLTFHQPMLVLLPYTQESESTVVQALNAFGKQDTIYRV